MNAPAPSIPSGNSFKQSLADQRPKYEKGKLFRRKLRRGRPAKNEHREYWCK